MSKSDNVMAALRSFADSCADSHCSIADVNINYVALCRSRPGSKLAMSKKIGGFLKMSFAGQETEIYDPKDIAQQIAGHIVNEHGKRSKRS